jgi:hypothetical protein
MGAMSFGAFRGPFFVRSSPGALISIATGKLALPGKVPRKRSQRVRAAHDCHGATPGGAQRCPVRLVLAKGWRDRQDGVVGVADPCWRVFDALYAGASPDHDQMKERDQAVLRRVRTASTRLVGQ